MDRLLLGLGVFAILVVGCKDGDRYTLFYEQSGGLGGILEYRLQIDSTGTCMVETLHPSPHRVFTQLDEPTYRRLGALLDDPDVWSSNARSTLLPPDAPHRTLTLRRGREGRSLLIGVPPPDAVRSVVALLDSIAGSLLGAHPPDHR